MAEESKVAIRRLVRGPDGKVHVVFVDARTGKQLDSIEGYEVKDSFEQQQELLGISPTSDDNEDEDKKTTSEAVKERAVGEGTTASDQKQQQDSSAGRGGKSVSGRSMSNNFGFAQQPAAMNAVGFMPGIIGMMGKAANVGYNVNNVAASNAARQSLGLDRLGARQTIGGVLGVNDYDDGKVADVNIGNNTYGVSFGGITDDGLTSLTPNEARQRSMVTNQAITEATPAQARANTEAAATQRTGLRGFIDNTRGFASRALDSVFGGLWEGVNQVLAPASRRQVEPDYVGNLGYFPDRPEAPASAGGNKGSGFGGRVDSGPSGPVDSDIGRGIGSGGWGYSGAASHATDGGFGGSSQADHAASNPGGGLY